jgi:ribosomal protein L18
MGRLTRIQTTLESNRLAVSITDPHVIIQYIVFKEGSTNNIQPKDQPQ